MQKLSLHADVVGGMVVNAWSAVSYADDLQALIKEHMEHSERLCAHLPPWWKTGKKP